MNILVTGGAGYSVFQVVEAFENTNNVNVPYVVAPRRAGDLAECYADPSKSLDKLGWKAEKDIFDMCRDAWRWQSQNPDGYPG